MRTPKPLARIALIALFVALAFQTPLDRLNGEEVTLRDQLASVLKARRPEEFRFLDTVIEMVDANQLPRDLVVSTFLWVRKNKSKTKAPFVYFERALRIRAEKAGIRIP